LIKQCYRDIPKYSIEMEQKYERKNPTVNSTDTQKPRSSNYHCSKHDVKHPRVAIIIASNVFYLMLIS
jgi:hypothetical protein